MDNHFHHIPVLLEACIEGLAIKLDGTYIDGTAGGGGHSLAIAQKLSGNGRLISLDKDLAAIKAAGERLAAYPAAQVIRSDFRDMDSVLEDLEIELVDGILLDLGVSSHQLDTPERGFSYHTQSPLDMRMSGEGLSAKDIVNNFSWQELTRIFLNYGEEKYAKSIARGIEKERARAPIETTGQLAEIIKSSIPAAARRDGHPAKKVFQAIRIAVNGELESLERALDTGFQKLKTGGRFAIITFHSLEDRMVKQAFAGYCSGCDCPSDFPVCVCGKLPKARLINKKPITASADELEANNRARSAKLRVLEKI